MHTTAWNRHGVLIKHCSKFDICSSVSPYRILYCMDLDFALAYRPKGSEGDTECKFFTLDTYQETSVSDIFDLTAENGVSLQTHGRTNGWMDGKIDRQP